jgi:putative phosphoribosyl transferase
MTNLTAEVQEEKSITVRAGNAVLEGDLAVPVQAGGLVVFAHGSGSSRKSSRNRAVAQFLRGVGLGTLLFDLLTPQEEVEDSRTGHLRFNIPFLAGRLVEVTDWLLKQKSTHDMALGYFGASTGAAAALVAAAHGQTNIRAIVSRGGRPDLAGPALSLVKAPTLLIVGGYDQTVIKMNQEALEKLQTEKELFIVPGASHLFEEPGTLEEVARLAAAWFQRHLRPPH